MQAIQQRSRIVWMVSGVLAGMAIAQFWPHEPAQAITTDRDSRFALATTPVSFGQTAEGVFILDFFTGRLMGGVLNNKIGKFTNFYQRDLAADFQVDPAQEPHYAIVAGEGNLPSVGGQTTATGIIYVAELSSGKMIAYTFTYRESAAKLPIMDLHPTDFIQWREPMN